MKITTASLRDLHDRARTCLYWTQAIANEASGGGQSDDGEEPLGVKPFEELLPKYRDYMARASAGFEGKDDLLWFVSTTGVIEPRDWKLYILDADSAHRWLLLCGSVLSRWDGAFDRWGDEGDDEPPFAHAILPGEPLSVPVHITFDDEFRRMLEEASELLKLEHARASQFVLRQGGSVEVEPPPGRPAPPPSAAGVPASSPHPVPLQSLNLAVQKAWQSYQAAEVGLQQEGHRNPTDRDAYEWVKESIAAYEGQRRDDYELPDFNTWQRYVRTARRASGTQKNSPRAGRTGRSITGTSDA